MDRADVIQAIENQSFIIRTRKERLLPFGKTTAKEDAVLERNEIILAALREQEQSNEPLTYSQLWGMSGEPVWIVWPDGRIKSQWWIVGSQEWHMMDFYDAQSAREYGSVWLAYRKPPKEGAKE